MITTPENASSVIESTVVQITDHIGIEVKSRAYRVANELQNNLNLVLRGARNGRRYNLPNTGRVKYNKRDKTATIIYKKYTASSPGEAPANRTGMFRASWKRRTYIDGQNGKDFTVHGVTESDYKVKNGHLLGDILDDGTKDGRLKPRPYKQKTIDKTIPKIKKIYSEPY